MKAFNEFRTWALVTGAASGMGRIYSQRLAQMGYNIIMVDINAAGLQETESIVKAEVEAARTLAIVQDLSVADPQRRSLPRRKLPDVSWRCL